MTGAEHSASSDVNALELELRRLADVVGVSAAIDAHTGELIVTVTVSNPGRSAATWRAALDVAGRFYSGPVRIEVNALRSSAEVLDSPPATSHRGRVRLISVAHSPDDSAVVVRLRHGDRESAGTSAALPLVGPVRAVMAALESLGADLPFEIHSVTKLGVDDAAPIMVTLRSSDGSRRFGVVADRDEEVGVTKATLHALNRHLERVLSAPLASAG
ncbi:MAG TPA: hypothetical protein VE990_12050 [Acidimicrobiales bacterium]|nr:hypothetical protein [Acidimicrobiales bacterium]